MSYPDGQKIYSSNFNSPINIIISNNNINGPFINYDINKINNLIIIYNSLMFSEKKCLPFLNNIDNSKTSSLLQIIKQDDFIAGEISNTEIFITNIAKKFGWTNTIDWLKDICLKNFSDNTILSGIMHSLSHFDYKNINPAGVYIALAVLGHKDFYVRDYAIRAIENWNRKEFIPALKELSCDESWQKEYIDKVINGLEIEGF
ncbi:MAG: HEAT repeat domain-containing protein [Deltaproteobacteria bacterium]|jgi:hypothetical protein|nr:HEAT repeat domain-containing protein [Deltaproteobacteria bacterium]